MGRGARHVGTAAEAAILPRPRSPGATIHDPEAMPDRVGLRAAKLSIPHLPPGLVPRPRLVDRIAVGRQNRVTLVSAGPGWGKTQLVASWAANGRTPGPVAWLSLDADDNDPAVFWSYVLTALRQIHVLPPESPLTGLVVSPRLEAEQRRRITRGLASLPRPAVLVLDDLQEIRNGQILDGIAHLVRHPSALRLVLVTRVDPRLPLHRLRVDGALTEIRAADLAFTTAEATQLLHNTGVDLPPATREALIDRIEGWATGLRLAALFAARPGMEERIDEFAGDEGTVAEYLIEEVLAAQPPALRRFLLHTSVAERLCGDLADTLTSGSGAQAELERLEHANAFVVALGPGNHWFRYHPLLADLLRHRLQLEEPTLLPVLHRRAARWFATQGDPLEAVRHATRARDWPLLGHLVVTLAAPRALSAERQALGTLLAEIPASELHASAELRVCAALRQFIGHDYATLPHHLTQARALLRHRDVGSRRPTEVLLRLFDVVLARHGGDMPALIAATTDVLTWLPGLSHSALPAAVEYEGVALNNHGVGLLWLGEADQAEQSLRAASSVADDAGLELLLINALGYLGLLELTRGQLRAAQESARAGLDLAEHRGWTGLAQTIATYLTLALVHLERNDLAEAERLLDAGVTAQHHDPERVMYFALQAARARLLLAGGHVTQARAVIDGSREKADGWQPPSLLGEWMVVAEAEIDLAAGDPAAALRRLGSQMTQDSRPADHVRACAARAQLALGADREADALLAPVREAAANPVSAVEAWLMTALVADRQRADDRAMKALEHALATASAERIRRPFFTLGGARLQALLQHRRRLVPEDGPFAQEMLAELVTSAQQRLPAVPLTEPLTDREKIVLSHLGTMQSNEDIAAELFVSVNTVKTHARSLYRKLGVANRRKAVDRARELGLL